MSTKTAKLDPLPTKISGYEKPVDFTENFKWSRSLTTFTASSYQSWVRSILPQFDDMEYGMDKFIKIGPDFQFMFRPMEIWHRTYNFLFSTKEHTTRSRLEIYRGETAGYIAFDDTVYIPILCTNSKSTWMSLTPNEVLTLRGQVRRSKGDVGIAGLGLGWTARRILERKQVKKLTVYEKNEHVIEYFGTRLKDEFGDRLTLINCDAYEADWSQHDVSLWDIWDSYGGAGWDRKYTKIRDSLIADGKVCIGWGEGVTR